MGRRDFKSHPSAKFKSLGNLTRKAAHEEVHALREGIEYHNQLYFVKNQPEISDTLYDKLFHRLQQLEARFPELRIDSSPTQRVGSLQAEERQLVVHAAPMLSLHAAADEEEVARFHQFVTQKSGGNVQYFLEPKFDGISVELVYEQGDFRRASTRGDGQKGDDISANLMTNKDFVMKLPRSERAPTFLAVRGEAYLSKKAFQQINKERLIENLEPFANPRNAAAGMLHRLKPRTSDRWSADVIVYDILKLEGSELKTQHEVWAQLKRWGFKNSDPIERTSSLEEIRHFHHRLEIERDKLPFEIDGIVVKLDDLRTAEKLGTRHRSPRGALAWKFPPREEITILEDIVVQVGKSGTLTPVALLAPVDVGGVTVSRATLHNEREIHRKDLRPGDKVRIKRAGDVIPEIVERVKTAGRRGKAFAMPRKCPACGTTVVREEANCFCPAGITCRGQLVCCLTHFASREALDIEGLGHKTAAQLVEHDLVNDISDLFRLTADELLLLPGFAAGSANKLQQAIQGAKNPRLDRFLHSLAIRHVGQRTAQLLAYRFRSLRNLRDANEEQVADVAGGVVARNLHEFFANSANKHILRRLERCGVKVQDMPALKVNQALNGKTFVFTGTLSGVTREEAKKAVEAHGGRAVSSVSYNTDYVVAGAKPGSKLTEAKEFEIEIIDESAFRKLLREATTSRK